MTPGQKIKKARDYARPRLTQQTLADLVGMSRATIAKWETDKLEPDVSQIRPLAERLGILPDWFFDERTDEVPEPEVERVESDLARNFATTMAIRSWDGAMAADPEDEIEFLPADVNHEVPTAFLVGGPSRAEHHDVVRVRGSSLTPRVHSGELILFHRDDVLRRNTIVLAESADHKVYVKALRYDVQSGRYQLHSLSPTGAVFNDLTGWKVFGYAIVIMGDPQQGERNIEWSRGEPLKV